ncbi:MAG: FKBP-type peptidyl-prolyl cis-trans isomerase [Bacteroidales bacterium]|nr:FKBP-type peptidyl-prolyl cis-trans isomerase [Bacteroidales bacterium]
MKKIFAALFAFAFAGSLYSQDRPFNITDGGLMYRFEKSNPAAQSVYRGDVLVGEMTLAFEGDTIMSNAGDPQRIIQVGERSFIGDLSDALTMMHKGDVAEFGIQADELSKFLDEKQMPAKYKKGAGMRFFYTVKIDDIMTPSDLAAEQELYLAEMNQRKAEEPALIERYLNEHPAQWKQTKEGVYVAMRKEGSGKAVKKGRMVKADFVCRTLDGILFDTSIDTIASEEGLSSKKQVFEPLSYKVGELALIEGWTKGVEGQKAGSELTLVVPSKMAYGAQEGAGILQPYTPIVIDIKLLEVK